MGQDAEQILLTGLHRLRQEQKHQRGRPQGNKRRSRTSCCHPRCSQRKAIPTSCRICPTTWLRRRRWPTCWRQDPGANIRVCHQDDSHPMQLRRQPTGQRGGFGVLPTRRDQGTVQDCRAQGTTQDLRADARGQNCRKVCCQDATLVRRKEDEVEAQSPGSTFRKLAG